MTILEALKSISNYPVPQRVFNRVAAGRGLVLDQVAISTDFESSAYKGAESDIMTWLTTAPNVSEGGVSFSLSQNEREQLKREADSLLDQIGTPRVSIFGYKGENL
jgi:hypothetical protein